MKKLFQFLSRKDIRAGSIGSVVIKFGSAFFAFLNGILLARFLSLEEMGQYVLVFSTISILIIPTTLGLPTLLTRYVSKYIVRNQESYIKGLILSASKFVLVTTLAVYLLAFLLYLIWWQHFDQNLTYTVIYGLLLLPVLGFGGLRSGILRGMKHVILADLPDTFLRNFFFSILLLAYHYSGYILSTSSAMLLHLIGAGIAFGLGYVFLQQNLLLRLKKVKSDYARKEWLKESIPFSIIGGVQVIRAKSFSYILALFSSVEAVAIFDIAFRGATLVSFTLNALNSAISPFVSSMYEQGNMIGLQRILTKTSRIIFSLSLPVALAFVVGGKPLISFLFGSGYNLSYYPLVVLCLGQLVSASMGSLGMVLNMTGHQKVYSNNNLWLLILSVLLCIPFVKYFGALGASIVFSFILIVQNFYLYYFVRYKLDLKTSIF